MQNAPLGDPNHHAEADLDGQPVTCFAELVPHLHALSSAQPFDVAWCVEDLVSGQVAERFGDRVVPAASTRKVAILVATLAAVRSGTLLLDQMVSVDDRYRDCVHTGTLQHLSLPLSLTLRDVLTLMTIWSDNLCTAHVVDLIGLDAVNACCAGIGLTRTVHRHGILPALPSDHPVEATNTTSAGDQARLWKTLLDGATDDAVAATLGCDSALCAMALDILRHQQHRHGLPAMLPDSAVVACKSGHGWRDLSDGGIVEADGEARYLLTVYADGLPDGDIAGIPADARAAHHVAQLSRACWDALVPHASL